MIEEAIDRKLVIKSLVATAVGAFAAGFQDQREDGFKNPMDSLNMNITNLFHTGLGTDFQYYAALVSSLDSVLGRMLEKLAMQIAEFSYDVQREVKGSLASRQTSGIADLLEKYDSREHEPPTVKDYQFLRAKPVDDELPVMQYDNNYYLTDKETGEKFLINLKDGGIFDGDEIHSEKSALLEQFAILSNTLPPDEKISIRVATAYYRDGETKPSTKKRVHQFFAEEELLIGHDFWNFVCKSEDGYQIVHNAYQDNAHLISQALHPKQVSNQGFLA